MAFQFDQMAGTEDDMRVLRELMFSSCLRTISREEAIGIDPVGDGPRLPWIHTQADRELTQLLRYRDYPISPAQRPA